MAAVDFPSNPNDSDTFVANGVTYIYNSTKNVWSVSASTTVPSPFASKDEPIIYSFLLSGV